MAASSKKSWRQSPQVWPNNRSSLRDGFDAYFALSPGTGLSCPCRSRDQLAGLVSASGDQDHTTSPSANATLIDVTSASIASFASRVVTIAIRPLVEAGHNNSDFHKH
jgi:hypothetical protein